MFFIKPLMERAGLDRSDEAYGYQENATDVANEYQRFAYDQQRADSEPWRRAGVGALSDLTSMTNPGYDTSDLQNTPGYQFRMDEGMKAINSNASARGMRNSGATMKALTRYGQDYASNEYDKRFNRLSSIAGIGQNANALNAQTIQNYGNQMSSNEIGLGNAGASNAIAGANNMSNLIQQGATTAAFASDERLKKNIKPIPAHELKEFKATIKPYMFEYIDDVHGKGEFAGVMAQDLEKSKLGRKIVFNDKDGFKKIDLKKLSSLFLATLALEA